MPCTDKVTYIHEPTPLQCGQAVLAMISGMSVEEIIKIVGTDRETTLAQMKKAFEVLEISLGEKRIEVSSREELPDICLLSLETPRCWHWSLYFDGVFYDPEHGVIDDFPISNRKYYWKISRT